MTLERIRASLVQLGCPPNGEAADETYNIGTVLSLFLIQFISSWKNLKVILYLFKIFNCISTFADYFILFATSDP